MQFKKIIVLYCENHKKHTNTLCWQNANFLYWKISATYSKHWINNQEDIHPVIPFERNLSGSCRWFIGYMRNLGWNPNVYTAAQWSMFLYFKHRYTQEGKFATGAFVLFLITGVIQKYPLLWNISRHDVTYCSLIVTENRPLIELPTADKS